LVTINREYLPENDYDFILVAYDDENGVSIFNKYIDGPQLKSFLSGHPIHYEEMFYVEEEPSRVVFWAHSPERGWAERKEIKLK
jgi:hypothetical protein